MTRVVSLGLDGAAWHMLDDLMADGRLPNLQKLVQTGARAPLRSVNPPVTCPAWRCSTSGKNPGKVGVYWWLTLDRATGNLSTPDARSFETADIWDYLSDEGYRCAVVNVPMTYPPSPVNGIMVSGFGAPFRTNVSRSVTHPPEFQDQLFETYDWEIGIEGVADSGGPARARELIRSRFDFLLDLLDQGYEYIHLTVFYINMLQHEYGAGPETVQAWELIDSYLGELDDDVLTVIYSDHGHADVEATFSVNRYLIDEGYLAIQEDRGDAVTSGVYQLLKSMGVSPRTAANLGQTMLPGGVYEWIRSGSPTAMSGLGDRLDWEQSSAVAFSQGPVYVNREAEGAPDDLLEHLEDEFTDLRGPEGTRVLETVHRAPDIYEGDLKEAPDMMLVPNEGWEIYGGITPTPFETEVTSWTSGNRPSGILLLHGGDIEPMRMEEKSILDVVPTILRYLGCQVPTDLDGTAVTEPFSPELPTVDPRDPLPPQRSRPPPEDTDLESHLEALGYLL